MNAGLVRPGLAHRETACVGPATSEGLVHRETACMEPATSEQTGKPWSRVTCHTPRSFRNRRLATRPTLRMEHGAVRPPPVFSPIQQAAPYCLVFILARQSHPT